MNATTENPSPYEPPLSNDVGQLVETTPDYEWCWWTVLLLGVVAGATSVFLTVVYSQSTGEIPNAPTAQISLLTHYLRIGTFYIAGVILLLGFVVITRKQHRNVRAIVMLSVMSVVAQLGAEISAIMLSSLGVIAPGMGILLNMFLRSAFIIIMINWFLKLPIRPGRLAVVVFVGTLAWCVLYALLGFLGFTFCWSLVAAFQIWLMQTPRFPWADSPMVTRSEFLPPKIDFE